MVSYKDRKQCDYLPDLDYPARHARVKSKVLVSGPQTVGAYILGNLRQYIKHILPGNMITSKGTRLEQEEEQEEEKICAAAAAAAGKTAHISTGSAAADAKVKYSAEASITGTM
jgi:hypothetical protein